MAIIARKSQPGMCFVTLATVDRTPFFQTSRAAETFIEVLLRFRTHGDYKLHAYLVMPDHVHLLLTPRLARRSRPLEDVIARIQHRFADQLNTEQEIWETGFTAHPVQSLQNLETLRSYLHQAPVLANLAPSPELYPYSSAHRTTQKMSPSSSTTSDLKVAS